MNFLYHMKSIHKFPVKSQNFIGKSQKVKSHEFPVSYEIHPQISWEIPKCHRKIAKSEIPWISCIIWNPSTNFLVKSQNVIGKSQNVKSHEFHDDFHHPMKFKMRGLSPYKYHPWLHERLIPLYRYNPNLSLKPPTQNLSSSGVITSGEIQIIPWAS